MAFSINRKRLTCAECTRRKVKCDKTVPCHNCVTRNISCSRARTSQFSFDASSSGSATYLTESTPRRTSCSSQSQVLSLVETLQARVSDLELALQRARTPQTSPNENIQPHTPLPITSLHQREQFPSGVTPPEQMESEVEDAATILEFLAWGRRKQSKYQNSFTPRSEFAQRSPGQVDVEDDGPLFSSKESLRGYLETLLPSRSQIFSLVRYHCDCLLWYHGSFHSLVFWRSLEDFYQEYDGHIDNPSVDLQWASLLFAIITGSMTCAPRKTAQYWGFNNWEQTLLSKRWFKATSVCLHHSDYMSLHSIFSVQAIATMTHSAHMLGHSNSQSVFLASAVRIAQSLGLHYLGQEKEEHVSRGLVDREIGRRLWCQLCTQDWFSIPFTESYLINQQSFDTDKPRNCNEDDMKALPDDVPTLTNYSRFFYDIAALMPRVQDVVSSSNTVFTSYEKVLEYDQQMRYLATVRLPHYLQNVPIEPDWPCYVPWARRCLAISSSHKIIMIHRKFLGLSFTNPMFSRTRRTCVAAARTIIKEQKEAASDDGPILWIHHAFSVAAGIILCLEILHSPTSAPECDEHRQLVREGIRILSQCETNMIAKRGVPLLRMMLSNEQRMRENAPGQSGDHMKFVSRESTFNSSLCITETIRSFCEQEQFSFHDKNNKAKLPSNTREASEFSWPPSNSDCETFLSPNTRLSTHALEFPHGFEDIFALATNYIN